MILIITDKNRVGAWCEKLSIDPVRCESADVFVSSVQTGHTVWESRKWTLAVIDDVPLSPAQAACVVAMAERIARIVNSTAIHAAVEDALWVKERRHAM